MSECAPEGKENGSPLPEASVWKANTQKRHFQSVAGCWVSKAKDKWKNEFVVCFE